MKALGKCEDLVLKGATSGPCPDARAAISIAKACKATRKICVVCGGDDRVCGTSDDLTVAEIGFVELPTRRSAGPGAVVRRGGGAAPRLVTCVACVTGFKADCVSAAGAPSVDASARVQRRLLRVPDPDRDAERHRDAGPDDHCDG